MTTERGDDFVHLCDCNTVIEARGLEAALRGTGIHCVIKGLNHREQLGIVGSYVTLHALVRREDLAAASAIVASYGTPDDDHQLPDELRGDPDDELPIIAEQRRSHHDLATQRRGNRVALILSLVVGFGLGHLYRRSYALGMLFALWQGLAVRSVVTTGQWQAIALLLVAKALDSLAVWLLPPDAGRAQAPEPRL